MIPVGKKAKRLYAKMNHQFQLSYEAYVKRLIKLNPRKKALILKKAEETKESHRRDLRALAETNLVARSVGLYLAEQQCIDNMMKRLLKANLQMLRFTHP